MDQKKVNVALLLSVIFFAIGVAVRNIMLYFGGFGFAFVAQIILFAFVVSLGFVNKENRRRIMDVFCAMIVMLVLMSVTYMSYDWSNSLSTSLLDFIKVMTNIYSILSLVLLVYALVRYIAELNGKKIKFVEVVLGNEKFESKPKKPKVKEAKQPKEVISGDLEQKPVQEPANEKEEAETPTHLEESENQERVTTGVEVEEYSVADDLKTEDLDVDDSTDDTKSDGLTEDELKLNEIFNQDTENRE